MDAFFTGLTKSQAMLLLTAVTFGGQEGVESFAHLPDDEAAVLRHRAEKILAIPREQRVPLLVQEIKRFITMRRADGLRGAEPQRVAQVLADERPEVIEVILRALPASVANDVRLELVQPVVELGREILPEILAIIRWKFEERLAALIPERFSFAVTDLLVISASDLFCVADVLGARVLAPSVDALPAEERESLLAQLPPDQRLLVSRPIQDAVRRPDPSVARRTLEQALSSGEPRQAMRALGVRRIARVCLAQSAEFAARVIERHNDDFGRALAQAVSRERQAPPRAADGILRAELLFELEQLAARGIIERPVRLPPPPGPALRPSASRAAIPRAVSLPSAPRPPASHPARPPAARPAPPAGPPPRPGPREGVSPDRRQSGAPPRRPVVLPSSPMRGPRKP